MSDQIEVKNGRFVVTASARERINAIMRETGETSDPKMHEMMATTIIGPIKQMADYIEWTGGLFQNKDVAPGEIVRIVTDSPVAVALKNSADGEVFYVRPGRGTYSGIEFQMVDAGLEIGWDDLTEAGWDILEAKMNEVAQELARKRDAAALAVIDAAAAVVTNHAVNSASGSKMTKAAIDAIFKAAAPTSFKIASVYVNPATIMDQTDWEWAGTAGKILWNNTPETYTEQIFNKFSVSGYGGANWYTYPAIPTDKVYFFAAPQVMGTYRWRKGGLRTASAIDIDKKIDKHTWDERYGFYLGNPYSLWCLTITNA